MNLFYITEKILKNFGCCLCENYENCRAIGKYLENDSSIYYDENINKCKQFVEDMKFFNNSEFNKCDVKEILYIGICV